MEEHMMRILILLISFIQLAGAASEEDLLRLKAELLAKKTFIMNTTLVGIDPKTCEPSENSAILLKQLKMARKGVLTHCPAAVAPKLAEIENSLKEVNQGNFVAVPTLPIPFSAGIETASGSGPVKEVPFSAGESRETVAFIEETTSEVSSEFQSVDHSGLSLEERKRIRSYYEETKERYIPTEEDNLFTILSKAYVRNFKRILTPAEK